LACFLITQIHKFLLLFIVYHDIVYTRNRYGNGCFANQTIYPTGDIRDKPQSVAVGDFNNDAILDIVVVNYRSNNLGGFLGHGNGTFAEMVLLSVEYGSHPFFVLVGDFNDDQKLDLALANNGTDSLHILLQTC
jgi:hypothetical protein